MVVTGSVLSVLGHCLPYRKHLVSLSRRSWNVALSESIICPWGASSPHGVGLELDALV